MTNKNYEKAIAALLETQTVAEAAERVKLSEATLYRYLADDDFQKEYKAAKRRIFEQNMVRLQSLHSTAVSTLERNLNCENPSVEVRAAQIIIEASRKDLETMDILERLEVIEREFENKN